MKKDFNKIALESSLFKGHVGWFIAYLKTERLAHVLALLERRTPAPSPFFKETVENAALMPQSILRVVAGDEPEASILAHILSTLTAVRLLATRGEIAKENAQIIIEEYEKVAERVGSTLSPTHFVISQEDLEVALPSEVSPVEPSLLGTARFLKDNKGQYKGHNLIGHQKSQKGQENQEERVSLILDIIRKNNGISIKGISSIVRDCSEKTIQRELTLLIKRGLVVREGERRWSIYRAAHTA